MQTQGNIGVLGRIGARLLQLDLVKAQLLGALPRHILKFDGFQAQIFQCETVHVVSRAGRVQHVGLQHGVELDTGQAYTVIGQHIGIVFEVLPEFGDTFILKQRL